MKIWRRSYDIPPPALALEDPRHPRHDPRYRDVDPALLPATESLKDTLARVLPFWNQRIAPELLAGRNVLVTAHGNSLRAMVKMLDNRSEADIVELNIPTGVPLLYELDAQARAASQPLPGRSGGHRRRRRGGAAPDREALGRTAARAARPPRTSRRSDRRGPWPVPGSGPSAPAFRALTAAATWWRAG